MLKAYIDNIDGAYARVLIGEESVAVAIPVNYLPPRVREGMVLQVKFAVDTAATAARERKIPAAE